MFGLAIKKTVKNVKVELESHTKIEILRFEKVLNWKKFDEDLEVTQMEEDDITDGNLWERCFALKLDSFDITVDGKELKKKSLGKDLRKPSLLFGGDKKWSKDLVCSQMGGAYGYQKFNIEVEGKFDPKKLHLINVPDLYFKGPHYSFNAIIYDGKVYYGETDPTDGADYDFCGTGEIDHISEERAWS